MLLGDDMSALSDYLENVFLNFFRNQNITAPTTVYVGLASAATSDANTGVTVTELANTNGYARQAVTFSAPSGGATNEISNTGNVNFSATADWATATHFFIIDSATYGSGNILVHGPLTSPVTILADQTRQFPVGALKIGLG